jgi:ABC-type transport system involved in multi-copper enzyme maturation permease subunit
MSEEPRADEPVGSAESVGSPVAAAAVPAAKAAPLRRGGWWENLRAAVRFDIPGPVFQKEMRASQRKFAAFGSRMTYVLLLGGILSLVYFSVRQTSQFGQSPVRVIQQLQYVAPSLTVAVLWVQASLIVLLAPGMTAGAFSEERRKRTLDMLLTSPLRPWQIVLGKLLSGVASLSVLALCALPVLLAVRVFGGLEAINVVASFALSLTMGTLMASLAMLNSLWCKKSSTASFLAFIFFAVVHALPFVVGITASMIQSGMQNPPAGWAMNAMLVSAPMAMMTLTFEMLGGIGIPFASKWTWLHSSLFNLAVTGVVFAICTAVLRRTMLTIAAGDSPGVVAVGRERVRKTPAAGRGTLTPTGETIEGGAGTTEDRGEPRKKSRGIVRKTSREVGDLPVLWRELSQPLFKRPVVGIIGIVALAGFSLWVYLISTWSGGSGSAEPHVYSTNMVFAVIMLLQASTLTVAGFPSEREAKTWDVLLTSPLSGKDLILGKYAGALRGLWLMPTALLVNLGLLGVVAGHLKPIVLLHTAIIFAGPLLLLAALGTRFSMAAKSTNAGGTRTVLLALGLWGGLPLLGGIAMLILQLYGLNGSGSGVRELGEAYFHVVFAINPVWNFGCSLEGALAQSGRNHYQFGYPESSFRMSTSEFTLSNLGIMALYIVAALLILRWCAAVFTKKSGRTS